MPGDLHRHHDGEAVGAPVGQHPVRQRGDPAGGLRHVNTRAGAVRRLRLRISRAGPGRPGHLHGPGGTQVRPGGDAPDGDVHNDPLGVVLAQQPVPHRPPHHLPEIALHLRGQRLQPRTRRPEVHRGDALSQHEHRACREPVLTRVKRQRDMRIGDDPLQLLAEAQRGGEPEQAEVPLPDAARGDGRHHRAPGGREVGGGRGEVTPDHVVEIIRPADQTIHLTSPFTVSCRSRACRRRRRGWRLLPMRQAMTLTFPPGVPSGPV
jgi:hypothetical protein